MIFMMSEQEEKEGNRDSVNDENRGGENDESRGNVREKVGKKKTYGKRKTVQQTEAKWVSGEGL